MKPVQRTTRLFIVVPAVVFTLIASVIFVSFIWLESHSVSIRTHLQLIDKGMTFDQVAEIWGQPKTIIDFSHGWQTAQWDVWDGRLEVDFKYGKAEMISPVRVEPWKWLWMRFRRQFVIRKPIPGLRAFDKCRDKFGCVCA